MTIARYRAMEELCRRHAELDETTAARWLEEAELCSQLMKVEQRLQLVRRFRRPAAEAGPRPR
jgi:replicative DNA helicase